MSTLRRKGARVNGVIMCDPSPEAEWLRDHGYMQMFHLVYGIESGIPMCCIVYFLQREDRNARTLRYHYDEQRKCECYYVHCEECAKTCKRPYAPALQPVAIGYPVPPAPAD